MPGATQTAAGLGHLQPSPLLGHNQIAFQQQAESQAHDIAVRGRYNRFPIDRASQKVRRVCVRRLRSAEPLELLTRAQLALLNVSAAGEGAPTSTQNRNIRGRVDIKSSQ